MSTYHGDPEHFEQALREMRKRLGIVEDGPRQAGTISMGNDLTNFAAKQAAYKREMEKLHRAGADRGGREQLRDFMRGLGR